MTLSDNQIREKLLDEIIEAAQTSEAPDHAIRSALANVSERVIAAAAETSRGPGLGTTHRRPPRAGTSPLRRRVFRIGIPAAIAASVLLAVGLWPETGRKGSPGSRGRVYALSDIPELLHSAKVLHLHGWASGDQRIKLVKDYWLDATGGRWHVSHTVADIIDGSPPSEALTKLKNRGRQWIFDGQYQMALAYQASGTPQDSSLETDAEFTRLTPFEQSLRLRRYYEQITQSVAEFNDARALGLFAKAGQETLDGAVFDVWESEQDRGRYDKDADTVVYDGQNWIRIKVWLAPAFGVIGRVEKWIKGPETNGTWVLGEVAEKIERDVAPPPGIFETVPPAGCTLKNTKEAAPIISISEDCSSNRIGNLQVRYHIGFNLSDGTVLLGWSSRDGKSTESQAPLFQNLQPGGPLPKLPIEIHGLVPGNPDCELTYTGRHLAFTQKDDRFYEWSLFVPDKDLTVPEARCAGNLEVRCSLNSNQPTPQQARFRCGGDWQAAYTRIEDQAAFQGLVLEAMAELSESGIAPAGITYEYVTQLARQIRESLPRP